MSHFADRLVARGAGAPLASSITLFRPRPVSRFEPMAGLEIDAATNVALPVPIADRTGAEAPAVVRSSVERGKSGPSRSQEQSTIARTRESDTQSLRHETSGAMTMPPRGSVRALPFEVDEVQQAHPAPDPFKREIVETTVPLPELSASATGRPNAARWAARAEVADSHECPPPQAAEPISRLLAPEQVHETRVMSTEPLTATASRRATPMVREGNSAPSTPPAISIGKIEVQFLPQEPRVLQRPQPERTRGFAAYARARRGEPR